jgi:hypothetical protein
MDVESGTFIDDFTEKYEVVFCLAVIEHLKNKERFIKKLRTICTDYLLLEGNAGTNIEAIKLSLVASGFKTVDYIGLSDDEKDDFNNNRPLFVCRC